jgi:hypothetical protein
MGEACSSGPYENRVEPHFQQHAIADDAFAVGSSGSSTKQTAHLSNRGARCRGQCVWNTNVHSLRIHDHFAVRLVNRVDPPADEFRAAEAAEQGRADVPGLQCASSNFREHWCKQQRIGLTDQCNGR